MNDPTALLAEFRSAKSNWITLSDEWQTIPDDDARKDALYDKIRAGRNLAKRAWHAYAVALAESESTNPSADTESSATVTSGIDGIVLLAAFDACEWMTLTKDDPQAAAEFRALQIVAQRAWRAYAAA
jgi:hypothetical protein